LHNIVLRLDANGKIGLAHAVRVSSILKLLPFEIEITVVGNGSQLSDFFSEATIINITESDEKKISHCY